MYHQYWIQIVNVA